MLFIASYTANLARALTPPAPRRLSRRLSTLTRAGEAAAHTLTALARL